MEIRMDAWSKGVEDENQRKMREPVCGPDESNNPQYIWDLV